MIVLPIQEFSLRAQGGKEMTWHPPALALPTGLKFNGSKSQGKEIPIHVT
jgi:hypothetical protein